MLRYCLALFFSALCFALSGQQYDTLFLKFDQRVLEVTDSDKAQFIQLVPKGFTANGAARFTTFYHSGEKHGIISYFNGQAQGMYRVYRKNGNILYQGLMEKGKFNGVRKEWFNNGQLKEEIDYNGSGGIFNAKESKVINSWDSLGKPMVIDRSGPYEAYDERDRLYQKGYLTQGKRTGIWKAFYKSGELRYEERYDDSGQLINGLFTDEQNQQHSYTKVEERAQFPGGDKSWYRYLKKNLRYPRAATDAGIEGKVFLSFIVDKDGSVEDIKIIRGIGGGCDEESRRVLIESPKWEPAQQRGVPVKSRMQIQMEFKLPKMP